MSDTIEWTPVKIELSTLDYWDENPKLMTKKQAEKLEKSTQKLGRAGALLVGPEINGRRPLYDGHLRARVWGSLYGFDLKFYVWALESSRPLSDDERRAVSIMTITATGSLDWQKLAGWDFAELQDFGMDGDMLKALNNDANNLKELMRAEQAEPVDAEPQIDRAAELNEKWQVKTGDLWKIGEHRLLCGDASVAAHVARLDKDNIQILLTDPPYSSGGFQEAQRKSGSIGTRQNIQIASDQLSTRGYISLMSEVLANFQVDCVYMFTDWRMWCWAYDIAERANYPVRNMLIWDKGRMGMGFPWRSTHELVLFAKRSPSAMMDGKKGNVLHFERVPNENHPTEKPVELLQHILENSPDGGVYDPFCGSGTTMLACQNLSRKCRAIEISPNYCAVILERMATAFPELEIKRIE